MTPEFTHGYALLIGVNENQVAQWALPDVIKDIRTLAEVLAHPQRCAYPANQVRTITGPAATRDGILDGLDWLREQVEADASENATAVVYYTGHGWRDESDAFYFIPYNPRENRVQSSALRATDFAEAVAALQPRRLLVALDCCHAGGMGIKGAFPPAGYRAAAPAPTLFVRTHSGLRRTLRVGGEKTVGPGAKGLAELAVGQGRAVLSSSTGEQRSYMRPDGRMSLFTYHLVEALTGGAELKEGATEVLVSDVMGHVTRRVPASARDMGVEQTPDYQVSGNFAVALLLGGKGLSKGQPAPDPLTPITEATARRIVHTGGGDYVEGDQFDGDKVTIDASVHDDHSVHIDAGGDVAYAPGGTATVGDGNIAVGGSVGGPIIVAREGSTVHLGDARPAPVDRPPSEYDLAAVRALLTIALGDPELTALAFDHFPMAHDRIGRGMGKDEKVQVLVAYCEERGRTGELLELVRQRNPGRYAEYEPRLRRASGS